MTLAEFLNEFKLWGPLGIWAALTTWGCVHLYRNGRADTAAHAAETKTAAAEHAKALKDASVASEAKIAAEANAARIAGEEQAALFASKLDAQAQRHHGQMTELTNRFMGLVDTTLSENRELTQQVRSLIEVISRKRGR